MKDTVTISENKAIINGVEYKLGKTLRVQILLEEMMSAVENKSGVYATIVFFYAVLMALNSNSFKMEFPDFVDYLDSHPDMFKGLLEWSTTDQSQLKYFDEPTDEGQDVDDKKKD